VHVDATGDDAVINQPEGVEKWIARARPAMKAISVREATVMGKKTRVVQLKGKIGGTEVSMLAGKATVGKVNLVLLSTSPWEEDANLTPTFLKIFATLQATVK
jgi:hypothetical protein